MVPLDAKGEAYKLANLTGRLIGNWLEGPEVTILVFNIYGWTGGDQKSQHLQRTDDLVCIAEEECCHHPGAFCLIVGDFNASEGKLPTLTQMVTENGWTDCGGKAVLWGGIANQTTCRAGPNTKTSRIDFVIANEAIFPAIKGFQVDYCDIFKKHQVMQLKLEAGMLKQQSDRYRKTTSASKLIGENINKIIAENP